MEFSINVSANGHIATLEWNGPATVDLLREAVSLATDDALIARGLHRVEVSLPAGDDMARTAVQRAGFRLEGVRRSAMQIREDEFADVVHYSRLASDLVYGPIGEAAVAETLAPKKRVVACALLRYQEQVWASASTPWGLPAGLVGAGETPREAVSRVCRTDLAYFPTVGQLLTVDWTPPAAGWADSLVLVFDCLELSRPEAESLRANAGWGWTSDFTDFERPVRERLRQASSATSTIYLENGVSSA